MSICLSTQLGYQTAYTLDASPSIRPYSQLGCNTLVRLGHQLGYNLHSLVTVFKIWILMASKIPSTYLCASETILVETVPSPLPLKSFTTTTRAL